MARYLVIFKNQVDDVDVNGFRIMTDKELETYEKLAESITWGFSWGFGSSKLHFSDGQDLLTSLEYKEVSLDEAKSFKKLFGPEFGVFITDTFLERISADEIEDDELEIDDEEGLPLYDLDEDDY